MRYAIIESATVTNVIEWDGKAAYEHSPKCVKHDKVGIGDKRQGNKFMRDGADIDAEQAP